MLLASNGDPAMSSAACYPLVTTIWLDRDQSAASLAACGRGRVGTTVALPTASRTRRIRVTDSTFPERAVEHHGFRILHPGRGLRFLDGACLRLRSRWSNCDACVAACPVDAIRIDPTQTRVTDACTGCGRCAGACPTHALESPGFRVSVPTAPSGERRAVTIDCWKVPRDAAEPHAVRVPCLGGLRTSDLLALCAAAAPRAVRLLDRGWCAGCTSGGARHPAESSLAEARALLAEVGLAPQMLPAIESRPLPARAMPADIPRPDETASVSRRAFVRHLLGRAAAVVDTTTSTDGSGAAVPRFVAHAARPRTERSRVLDALRAVAQRAGSRLPARLFASAEAPGDCRDHNVCVAQCPTGALKRYEDDHTAGVRFDPDDCIECGLCAAACPEHAITIRAGARRTPPAGPETVTRHRLAACWGCGTRYAPREQERYCAACERSRDFAASAFRELFAAR
jgi:Fe-S-cluster-containing hydrogenase component 2